MSGSHKKERKAEPEVALLSAGRSVTASEDKSKYRKGLLLGAVSVLVPWGYSEIMSDSVVRITIGWFLLLVPLGLAFRSSWVWLRSKKRTKVQLALAILAGLTVSVGFVAGADFSISRAAQVSFVFVAPGVVVNGDGWLFTVNHSGPKSSYDVDVFFRDADRLEQIRKQGSASEAELQGMDKLLHFDEINPKGRGAVFAREFVWKPLVLGHEHFMADVSCRAGHSHEDPYIERPAGKWEQAMVITDTENGGKVLLTRRDLEFPSTVAESLKSGKVPCFPDISVKTF